MSRLYIAGALAICMLTTTGCGWADWILGKKVKPEYCIANPEDSDCPLIDASGMSCRSNNDCMDPAAGVCDVAGSMACVQCLVPDQTSACTGTTPACVGTTCQKCTQHAQCPTSAVCLPDGSCADQLQVAYVDPTGSDNMACSKLTPCTKVAKALATNRPYVKFHGVTDEAVSVSGGRVVTFLADPGAKLTRGTGNGAIVSVQGDGTSLSIYDLSVSDAPNSPSGIGCVVPAGGGTPALSLTRVQLTNNPGGGISAAAGMLTVSQSTVSGNTGGGISISGGAEFNITNTVIVTNGGAATVFGGVKIDGITAAGTHILDFDTIAANIGPATVNTGVTCGTVLVPLTFASNIIYANIVSGGGIQIGGSSNCSTTYSDIGPDTVPGTNNINIDPMFVSAMQGNFHLMASSPAKNVADPAAALPDDIDGDPRPQGPRRDMGADEVRQ